MDRIKIIFFGTPEFAVTSLDAINQHENVDVVGVVTVEDKGVGRGRKIQISPIKKYALENDLLLFQPTSLVDDSFINEIKKIQADVFFVVAFRKLPDVIWQLPPLGTINLHSSLLPDYRGAAPINWAIINGETETGVTTFFIDDKIDNGDIIYSRKALINNKETAGELHDRLKIIGAELVIETINHLLSDKITCTKQELIPVGEVKKAPKINKIDCKINWHDTGIIINDFVRGLSPYPSAFTEFVDSNGNIISFKIYSVSYNNEYKLQTGEIYTDYKNFVIIGAKDSCIEINELQLAGKKKMKIKEFLRGNKWDSDWKIAYLSS